MNADVESIRDRLRAALAAAGTVKSPERPCPTCHGTGIISRLRPGITHADVAAAIGVSRTSIANFLGGRQTFTLAVGLRLIAWLDAQESVSR